MDIMEWIIVHTLGKIDRIQYFHFISMPHQHLSALNDDRSFRVRNYITDVFPHLHQIRFYIKASFSGTRSANHNHVLVPCKFRILWSAIHGQPFSHGKKNIVLEYRVDKRCNVFCSPPSCRTILHSLPELLGIFSFQVDHELHSHGSGQPNQQFIFMHTWKNPAKCQLKIQD